MYIHFNLNIILLSSLRKATSFGSYHIFSQLTRPLDIANMVGVAGKSQGCNTCRKRKVKVCQDYFIGKVVKGEDGCSVIKERPHVANVRNLNGNALDINGTGTSKI